MNRDIIKIYAENGKEFSGTDYKALVEERDTYEADLKLKEAKAEAERKASEEKKKKLDQYRESKLKEINDILQKSKSLIDEYEKETGNKLIYGINYCGGGLNVKEVKNSIDYAWDNLFDDIFRTIRSK